MKKMSSTIFQGLTECVLRYAPTVVIAIILLLVSSKTVTYIQNIIQNISGGLLALPIVFLFCDLYQIIITRSQREMVTARINSQMEDLFVRFLFMAYKFRVDFAAIGSPDFLEDRQCSAEVIFNEISSVNHKGFIIFSYFDNFCIEIKELLESPLLISYVPNYIISLLCEFSMEYQKLLNEFKMISDDDFIRIGTDNLEFTISEIATGEYVTYGIQEIGKEEKRTIYLANYPIFDEPMLCGIYRISGIKAKTLSAIIFRLYSLISKWEKYTNNVLHCDSCCITVGRISQDPIINFHAQNHIKINVQWPA